MTHPRESQQHFLDTSYGPHLAFHWILPSRRRARAPSPCECVTEPGSEMASVAETPLSPASIKDPGRRVLVNLQVGVNWWWFGDEKSGVDLWRAPSGPTT